MYSLAFDTTGAGCGIILQQDGKTIDKFEKFMDFGQSEVLMPQLKNMLNTAGLSFNQLDSLFVCVGPGSFTGVRASVSSARVFALVCPKLKIGGISAFDAYVNTFSEAEIAPINAVIIETRRDDFYIQLFDGHLQKISEPEALPYDEIITRLKDKGCLVSLAGDGVERFLSRPSGLCLHAIKMFEYLPIEALAAAGMKALEDKRLNFPKPLYLRAPDVTLPNKSATSNP